MPVVTLITRTDCHLCDEARTVVEGTLEDLNRTAAEIGLVEQDVDADAGLAARWTDDVPVVLIDGEFHARWRVDPVALRLALTA